MSRFGAPILALMVLVNSASLVEAEPSSAPPSHRRGFFSLLSSSAVWARSIRDASGLRLDEVRAVQETIRLTQRAVEVLFRAGVLDVFPGEEDSREETSWEELRVLMLAGLPEGRQDLESALAVWKAQEQEVSWVLVHRGVLGEEWRQQPSSPEESRAKRLVELGLRTDHARLRKEVEWVLEQGE